MTYFCAFFLILVIFLLSGVRMRDFQTIIAVLKEYIAQNKEIKIYDKDVAKLLHISQSNFATMKKRNSTPFAEILEFCKREEICSDEIFFD